MEDGNSQVTFMFQVGLVRDVITTDASQLTLKTLKDLACNFINQRVSSIHFDVPKTQGPSTLTTPLPLTPPTSTIRCRPRVDNLGLLAS